MTHKKIIITLCTALLVVGCGKKQSEKENKECSRVDFDIVYNEIETVLDMYFDTAVADDDLCEPIEKLSSDVLEVVATDSNFAQNTYLRAFSCSFFEALLLYDTTRSIPFKCYEKLYWAQNVFTTFSCGTWDYMTSRMMPSWQEYESRFVSLSIMKSTDGREGLVATFVNFTDTVIKNPTIVFERDGKALLELNPQNAKLDESESGDGIVRLSVDSLDEVLEALKHSWSINAFYDTPKERVQMYQSVLFLDHQRIFNSHVRNIFG
ncbi:MAG: hypothetical protein IK032_00100 [Bacteroidales bacterium]|nr:hypothetical protein [Bacteroidales bacterium]